MKELPSAERPYERCRQMGVEALSDAELLAILLRNGTKEQNSLELAIEILRLCGDSQGIVGLKYLTRAELVRLRGIGPVKAIQIQAAIELAVRLQRDQTVREEEPVFSSPEVIADYYMNRMNYLQQEEMHLLFLDNKNRRIQDTLLTRGTVNASLVSTRELFLEALRHCAVHVVMIHNHPSGDPTPSREDIHFTQKVKKAGELLDIRLIDHIVIGNHRYTSLHGLGYI